MPSSRCLDPDDRVLYGASLRPPTGYVFDRAVATTYSLDLETALVAPVSLALFAPENREEILNAPLALFEGVERIADRLLVFADAGQIKANKKAHSRLCSLLEQVVVEVAAPEGGAFHPKIWALRYKPLPENEIAPVRVRLLVMSRNLTRDRSWDIALTLDGVVAERVREDNRPLANLVRRLPDFAIAGLPVGAGGLVEEIAEDLLRGEWNIPSPFESVSFAVNGLDNGGQWLPEACDRLGVITPFCDDRTLSKLAGQPSREGCWLIGRSYELARIKSETLKRFGHVAVLDEYAETEDGEDTRDEDETGRVRRIDADKGQDSRTDQDGEETRDGEGDEEGRVRHGDDDSGHYSPPGQDGEDTLDGGVDGRVRRDDGESVQVRQPDQAGEDARDGDDDGRVRPDYVENGQDGRTGEGGQDDEDGGDIDAKALRGLHAKVYVAEKGWNTSVTVGSGNATGPALLSGKNVEVFATLIGRRSRVGSVDEMLGVNGFGSLTCPFQPGDLKIDDTEEIDAAIRRDLDDARTEICRIGLEIRCERDTSAIEGDPRWRMLVVSPTEPLKLREIESIRIWPITWREDHAQESLDLLRQGQTIDLGSFALADLTRFIAFQLTHKNGGDPIMFSTGLVINGLPEERNDAILRQLIVDKDAFLRYLRLLLYEFGDPFSAAMAALESAGWGKWRNPVDDMPVLEEMVRAFCRGDEQFEAIDRLMKRLGRGGAFGADPGKSSSNPAASTGQEPDPGGSDTNDTAGQGPVPGVSNANASSGQEPDPGSSKATASTKAKPVPGNSGATDPIPAEFRTLWRAFQEAYHERRSKHER